MPSSSDWNPTTFLRFEEALDTSMGTARIVTNAGRAYIKAPGSRRGPHPLACEWVGTQLAEWFGLPTLDYALMSIDAGIDEIPFFWGGIAATGTAFVTRAVAGHVWGGSADELDRLVNPSDVTRLVVFDTWTRNCDRHPPDLTRRRPNYDNLFLQDAVGKTVGASRLLAIDHSECFTCGADLSARASAIEFVKDRGLYGLFPGFIPKVRQDSLEDALDRLTELSESVIRQAVDSIPADWEVDRRARDALGELIQRRAAFVAESISVSIATACWPGRLFQQ